MAEIVAALPQEVVMPALTYPDFRKLLETETGGDPSLREAIEQRLAG